MLANAVHQPMNLATDPPPSRASPLPQFDRFKLPQFGRLQCRLGFAVLWELACLRCRRLGASALPRQCYRRARQRFLELSLKVLRWTGQRAYIGYGTVRIRLTTERVRALRAFHLIGSVADVEFRGGRDGRCGRRVCAKWGATQGGFRCACGRSGCGQTAAQ